MPSVIDIVLNLAAGIYAGTTISVPAGVRLTLVSSFGSQVFQGASPALTLNSGALIVAGATFINSTNASTILVSAASGLPSNACFAAMMPRMQISSIQTCGAMATTPRTGCHARRAALWVPGTHGAP